MLMTILLAVIMGMCLTSQASSAEVSQPMNDVLKIRAHYYQQFDADYSLPVPGEGYGGWQQAELDFSASHTAVVVMHAWDCGTLAESPGVWKSVEYVPRSYEISRTIYPKLLPAVRESRLPVFHVVGGGPYYHELPGFKRAVALAGVPEANPERVAGDPLLSALHRFRADHVWRGAANNAQPRRPVDFLPEARPVGDEGVADTSQQLLALCREHGINHLVYTGFAIDACLLSSPGGMLDMSRHGIMCSAIREAVTAVENKETAREEVGKELGLWRVAVSFGFVFAVDDFIAALKNAPRQQP